MEWIGCLYSNLVAHLVTTKQYKIRMPKIPSILIFQDAQEENLVIKIHLSFTVRIECQVS
jgi:hypothetical protein